MPGYFLWDTQKMFGTAHRALLYLILLTATFVFTPPGFAKSDIPNPEDVYVGDLFKYPILEVGVTQEAVGMRAVKSKAAEMIQLSDKKLKKLLIKEAIPVILAPNGKFYQIDHHHQALAAHKAGRTNAYYRLDKDYSKLEDMNAFWARMKEKHWVREFDHAGKRIKIPEGLVDHVTQLVDDPYRSLAWFVRKSGGYKKTGVEFAEFQWADFFRSRIRLGETTADFNRAIERAMKLAVSDEARAAHLPGLVHEWIDCKHWLFAEH